MDRMILSSFTLALCLAFTRAAMKWSVLEDPEAVCNDYSRAGFFIENTGSTKWIVFFESGGLCYSAETCNRRFFRSDVRTEFSNNQGGSETFETPNFNFTETWNTIQNRPLRRRINPYMTSVGTYIDDEHRFFEVEGRDLLDGRPEINPVFHDFNRVVVPYCSSDVWLAQDDFVAEGVNLTSADPQMQFLNNSYIPEADTLQFTFRGQTILKSVFIQLLQKDKLSNATELLLAGSSAGGLGVVNSAKWIISELENNSVSANVSILVDSSWFIDFRGNIMRTFDGSVESTNHTSGSGRAGTRLFDLIDSIPQCALRSPTGTPCCISLDCILSEEEHFPVGEVPLMVVFSIYDIFLLGDALARLTPPGVSTGSGGQPNLGSEFIFTVPEYGGAMNASIINTASELQGISFVATQCFQHIYFATSTLWGPDSIFGDSSSEQLNISLGEFSGSFMHNIQSDVWRTYDFGNRKKTTETVDSCNTNQVRTIQGAVNMWYRCRNTNVSLQFRDTCHSIHCHDSCPDTLSLADLETRRYPNWSIIMIICIVVVVTLVSILIKIAAHVWEVILFSRQDLYLERVREEEEFVDGVPQFPVCGLEEAVSVACLDLKYSVSFRKKKIKDEKKDSTSISLAITQDLEDEEEEEDPFAHRRSTIYTSIRRRRQSQRQTDQDKQHSRSIKLEEGEVPTRDSSSEGGNVLVGDEKRDISDANLKGSDEETIPRLDELINLKKRNYSVSGESDNAKDVKKVLCSPFKSETKQILKGISTYFNPGELVGIMGPSGCGKTTFLDLLTGRRRTGNVEGTIYVNGKPMDEIRDQYVSFTGYVLQLATPYYEGLTVRENLTLAAQMKLPEKMRWREKFERVEQVIEVTALTKVSETVVGGLSGPGLSGGQKKRLVVALQLLTMPKVIFLDEPTSGLDATASIELLNHLNKLADSNRTVVLTIHQPRFEIFYMFHKLVLLSDGKIAYHGVPQKAYGFFVEALMSSFLRKNLVLPKIEEHNPADLIMDMLGKPHFRQAILEHYQESTEPALVQWAIKRASMKDFESMSMASLERDQYSLSVDKYKELRTKSEHEDRFEKSKTAGLLNRLAVLEARAHKRTTLVWKAYLPAMFFLFAFVLGTVYIQQTDPLLVVTAFCVYSVASGLFMFPVMHTYFIKALEVYGYEKADGSGRDIDLVIQCFFRFTTLGFGPAVLGSLVVYFLSVNVQYWSIKVYLQLLIVNMALNQTWIALLICLLCALPSLSFRLSPIISSVAGFASGFFIPLNQTPWWYRWLFFINPNYYGFSASANILLTNFGDCNEENNILDCVLKSGRFVLTRFNFDQTRPFMNVAILLLMTLLYLLLAALANWLHHNNFFLKLKAKLKQKPEEDNYSVELSEVRDETYPIDDTPSPTIEDDQPTPSLDRSDVSEPRHDSVSNETQPSKAKNRWVKFAAGAIEKKTAKGESIELQPLNLQKRKKSLQRQRSCFLDEVEHAVYKPGQSLDATSPGSQFANLVNNLLAQKKKEKDNASPRLTLQERQMSFHWHTTATKEVVKEQTEELISKFDEHGRRKNRFRNVTQEMTQRMKAEKRPRFASIVGQAMVVKSKDKDNAGTNDMTSSAALMWKKKAGRKDADGVKATTPLGNLTSTFGLESINEEATNEVEVHGSDLEADDEVFHHAEK